MDTSAEADQPIADHLDRHTLVFNGEIYNYRELARELPGVYLRTTGDSEVLVELLARRGEAALNGCRGMFAVGCWDSIASTLLLARDRMGQKPLYYRFSPDGLALAFSSEIRPLLLLPWPAPGIDRASIEAYLRWGYVPQPRTALSGIQQLLPGHLAIFSRSGLRIARYWSEPAEPLASSLDQQKQLLQQAVSEQSFSDVPLGCLLSGGIDSSVMALLLTKALGDRGKVHTFCVGFGNRDYDERSHARAVADHLGTTHHEEQVEYHVADDLPMLVSRFGEPFADSSLLPTHYLSKIVRQHVTVAISGDGGDELFGGYERYRALLIAASLRRGLGPVLGAMLRCAGRLGGSSRARSPLRAIHRLAQLPGLSPSEAYTSMLCCFGPNDLPEVWGNLEGDEVLGEATSIDHGDPARAAASHDRKWYLPCDILTKVDRCSMAHALEVRSPFLDHRVVEMAAGLTSTDYFGTLPGANPLSWRGTGKDRLRQAFSAELPKAVFQRRKQGFATPVGDWMRLELGDMLESAICDAHSLSTEFGWRPVFGRMLTEHRRKQRDHSHRLFAVLTMELWAAWLRRQSASR